MAYWPRFFRKKFRKTHPPQKQENPKLPKPQTQIPTLVPKSGNPGKQIFSHTPHTPKQTKHKKNHQDQDSNRKAQKGPASRIGAEYGTLSQNGYGEHYTQLRNDIGRVWLDNI